MIKWLITVVVFAVLNKNRVVVFIMTLFWGAYGTRLASGMYVRVMLWLFCSSISGGPCVGRNLIAYVSSIYKWCVQWLTWESWCCRFLGVDCLKGLDFLWPGFDIWWNVDFVAFQWSPKITWGWLPIIKPTQISWDWYTNIGQSSSPQLEGQSC